MNSYTKPQSVAIGLAPQQVLADSLHVNNSLYQGDDSDSDYGTQFSARHGWSDDDEDFDEEE